LSHAMGQVCTRACHMQDANTIHSYGHGIMRIILVFACSTRFWRIKN